MQAEYETTLVDVVFATPFAEVRKQASLVEGVEAMNLIQLSRAEEEKSVTQLVEAV